jgi:hypothetical protein
VELTGADLEKHVGKPVDVTGAVDPGITPVDGAAQVIHAINVTSGTGKGCKVIIAAASDAGAAAAAGAGIAGLSTGATTAIVGGVVVAGTLGGLAAAGEFNGGVTPASSNGSSQ